MTAHLVYAIGDKHVGEIGACCGGKLSSGSGATEGIGGIDYGYGMVAIGNFDASGIVTSP